MIIGIREYRPDLLVFFYNIINGAYMERQRVICSTFFYMSMMYSY